jgi:hypothetical protein
MCGGGRGTDRRDLEPFNPEKKQLVIPVREHVPLAAWFRTP